MEKTAVKGASSARTTYVAEAGLIAAVYAACTLVALLLLQGLAWGPVQFRISEALTVLINGTGALGLLDVVFGSAATLIGALWCRKFAENPKLAMLGPVLANAIIVPAYLPILLQGLGFYTIPFTTISLDGAYLPMYLFGLIATGIGEAAVIYILGTPLLAALRRAKVFAK